MSDKGTLEAALRSAGFSNISFREVGAEPSLIATVLGRKWHAFAVDGMSISDVVKKFQLWDSPPITPLPDPEGVQRYLAYLDAHQDVKARVDEITGCHILRGLL